MQHKIQPIKGPIHAKVSIPGSKKITHRALMLAALAEGVSEISNMHLNKQTKTFIDALHQVGIVIQLDEKAKSCIVAGGNGQFPKKQANIWCGEAKTAASFMLPASAATPGVYYFDGSSRLRQLNIENVLHLLRRQGAQCIPNDATQMPFTLIGADTFEGGEILFDGKENRLIHAFLMIAPYARSPFNFSITDFTHHNTIDLTCAMMAEFGVLVHHIHQGQLMVPVPQRYQARDYVVEPDFALASYFFAAAAISGGEVTIQPAKRSISKQSNIKILTVLEKMGCQILERHAGLTVKGPVELNGIEVSMRDFSDSFVTIAALAPFANKPTSISHIGQMTAKESTRLTRLKQALTQLNVQVETGNDWIRIFPGNLRGNVINPHQDYRLAMAFAIIGLKQPDIIIENPLCVDKIYPDFFAIWDKLTEPMDVSA